MKDNQKIIVALVLGIIIGVLISPMFFRWSYVGGGYGRGMMWQGFGGGMVDHMFFGPWFNVL